MEKSSIVVGAEYAVREPAKPGVEFQHVKVLEHVRGTRWKVEWIEPNPGLVDYVASKNFIVRWSERRAFLRDEQSAETLARLNREFYPGKESPIASAVEDVFQASGETSLQTWGGPFEFEPDALARVCARAGIDVPTHPLGYVDRHGVHRLPFEKAVEVARAFAGAEPQSVIDYVDIQERRYANEARQPGNHYMNGLLSEWRASWALVRQWAGHDVAVAAREDRIAELERLLTQVMWDLRRPNADVERVAARIERALR